MKPILYIFCILSNAVVTVHAPLNTLAHRQKLPLASPSYHEVPEYKSLKHRNNYAFIYQNNSIVTSCNIKASRRLEKYNHGRNKEAKLILGGDVNSPPGFLKDMETSECRELTMDLWNRGASIHEAIDRLNSLSTKADDSVMDNFMYGNVTFTEDKDYPPGIVDPEEETDEIDAYDSDEGDCIDLNFGLLNDDELLLVRNIMEERIKKKNCSYKSQIINDLSNNGDLRYTRDDIEKYIEKFDSIATLLINLNKNVDRNLLDLDWIPAIENRICEFVAGKSFTVSTITWTESSIDVTLKEENIPERKIDALHDSLFSFINRISRRESFHGLHNLGLMVSGS